MRMLVIGDMHVVPSEIEDADAVIDLALATASAEAVDAIVFTGDQTHTNAILRLEVQGWWAKTLERLSAYTVILMVGNHDQAYPGADLNSMSVLRSESVHVFDAPTDYANIFWVPYVADAKVFERLCQASPSKTVFCHQEFNGANYDNGFPILNGVDPDALPQLQVVSGHIHSRARFGKVWYPGSPRWRNLGDANTDKAIYVVDVDDIGTVTVVSEVSTEPVCRKIFHLTLREEEDLPKLEFSSRHRYHADVYGSPAWTKTVAGYLSSEFGVKVRTFPYQSTASVSEAAGIDVALDKFLDSFPAPNGTSSTRLKELVGARV